jgi:ATP-binding cassette, subfamily B, bacterial IrtA/YbtP
LAAESSAKSWTKTSRKIEGFIAHQLPDIVASLVAPIVMLAILMVVDWRLGLCALAGIVVAISIQIRAYGNDGAKKMMDEYQNALEDMNNAAVEYVRGITVVKAFGQSVYSLRRMYEAIKAYTRMVIPYTLSWENYMSAFTTIVNNIYLFLVPVGILIAATHTRLCRVCQPVYLLSNICAQHRNGADEDHVCHQQRHADHRRR